MQNVYTQNISVTIRLLTVIYSSMVKIFFTKFTFQSVHFFSYRRRFVTKMFYDRRRYVEEETFCKETFVEETFCAETFCMGAIFMPFSLTLRAHELFTQIEILNKIYQSILRHATVFVKRCSKVFNHIFNVLIHSQSKMFTTMHSTFQKSPRLITVSC
jgi:hypothetical protein